MKRNLARPTLILAGLLLLAALAGCTGTAALPEAETSPARSAAEETLGIEVVALRYGAQGYMLDFRYRIVDPERAAVMVDRQVKPYLVHEATGAQFMIPSSAKIGPLRQTSRNAPPEAGRVLFMLFANPGKYVEKGDLVTVVVGDQRLEHLRVE